MVVSESFANSGAPKPAMTSPEGSPALPDVLGPGGQENFHHRSAQVTKCEEEGEDVGADNKDHSTDDPFAPQPAAGSTNPISPSSNTNKVEDEAVRDLKKCILRNTKQTSLKRSESEPDLRRSKMRSGRIAQPGGFRRHFVLTHEQGAASGSSLEAAGENKHQGLLHVSSSGRTLDSSDGSSTIREKASSLAPQLYRNRGQSCLAGGSSTTGGAAAAAASPAPRTPPMGAGANHATGVLTRVIQGGLFTEDTSPVLGEDSKEHHDLQAGAVETTSFDATARGQGVQNPEDGEIDGHAVVVGEKIKAAPRLSKTWSFPVSFQEMQEANSSCSATVKDKPDSSCATQEQDDRKQPSSAKMKDTGVDHGQLILSADAAPVVAAGAGAPPTSCAVASTGATTATAPQSCIKQDGNKLTKQNQSAPGVLECAAASRNKNALVTEPAVSAVSGHADVPDLHQGGTTSIGLEGADNNIVPSYPCTSTRSTRTSSTSAAATIVSSVATVLPVAAAANSAKVVRSAAGHASTTTSATAKAAGSSRATTGNKVASSSTTTTIYGTCAASASSKNQQPSKNKKKQPNLSYARIPLLSQLLDPRFAFPGFSADEEDESDTENSNAALKAVQQRLTWTPILELSDDDEELLYGSSEQLGDSSCEDHTRNRNYSRSIYGSTSSTPDKLRDFENNANELLVDRRLLGKRNKATTPPLLPNKGPADRGINRAGSRKKEHNRLDDSRTASGSRAKKLKHDRSRRAKAANQIGSFGGGGLGGEDTTPEEISSTLRHELHHEEVHDSASSDDDETQALLARTLTATSGPNGTTTSTTHVRKLVTATKKRESTSSLKKGTQNEKFAITPGTTTLATQSAMPEKKVSRAATMTTVFILTKSMIGTGIFTLARPLGKASVVNGSLVFTFISCLCAYCCLLLIRARNAHHDRLRSAGQTEISKDQLTFESLAAHALGGKWGKIVFSFFLLAAEFAMVISSCIAIASALSGAFRNIVPEKVLGDSVSRETALLLVVTLLLIPQCWVRKIKYFVYNSFVGALTTLWCLFYVLGSNTFQLIFEEAATTPPGLNSVVSKPETLVGQLPGGVLLSETALMAGASSLLEDYTQEHGATGSTSREQQTSVLQQAASPVVFSANRAARMRGGAEAEGLNEDEGVPVVLGDEEEPARPGTSSSPAGEFVPGGTLATSRTAPPSEGRDQEQGQRNSAEERMSPGGGGGGSPSPVVVDQDVVAQPFDTMPTSPPPSPPSPPLHHHTRHPSNREGKNDDLNAASTTPLFDRIGLPDQMTNAFAQADEDPPTSSSTKGPTRQQLLPKRPRLDSPLTEDFLSKHDQAIGARPMGTSFFQNAPDEVVDPRWSQDPLKGGKNKKNYANDQETGRSQLTESTRPPDSAIHSGIRSPVSSSSDVSRMGGADGGSAEQENLLDLLLERTTTNNDVGRETATGSAGRLAEPDASSSSGLMLYRTCTTEGEDGARIVSLVPKSPSAAEDEDSEKSPEVLVPPVACSNTDHPGVEGCGGAALQQTGATLNPGSLAPAEDLDERTRAPHLRRAISSPLSSGQQNCPPPKSKPPSLKNRRRPSPLVTRNNAAAAAPPFRRELTPPDEADEVETSQLLEKNPLGQQALGTTIPGAATAPSAGVYLAGQDAVISSSNSSSSSSQSAAPDGKSPGAVGVVLLENKTSGGTGGAGDGRTGGGPGDHGSGGVVHQLSENTSSGKNTPAAPSPLLQNGSKTSLKPSNEISGATSTPQLRSAQTAGPSTGNKSNSSVGIISERKFLQPGGSAGVFLAADNSDKNSGRSGGADKNEIIFGVLPPELASGILKQGGTTANTRVRGGGQPHPRQPGNMIVPAPLSSSSSSSTPLDMNDPYDVDIQNGSTAPTPRTSTATSINWYVPEDFMSLVSLAGMTLYSAEYVNTILPIYEAHEKKDNFPLIFILCAVCVAGLAWAISFTSYLTNPLSESTYCFADLPEGPLRTAVQLCVTAGCFLSIPVLFFVIPHFYEKQLFHQLLSMTGKSEEEVSRRKWCKNGVRTLILCSIVLVAILLGEQNVRVLTSFVGGFACAPLAFIFPVIIFNQLGEPTPVLKVLNYGIGVFGILACISCTYLAFTDPGGGH
ncbi:unnamed protein product [Amoebophrya sp. A120]|nr:unnamed protein product [Amoebophrya sp. A120]|eukprot:GSA120T00025657001.1